jgi:glucose-6-phosphate isomerase
MIQLHYDHQLDDSLNRMQQTLQTYTNRLRQIAKSAEYKEPESSICLPGDNDLLEQVQALVQQKVSPALRYHIVVGIGGSNLGAKAVYEALRGNEALQPQQFPKLLFAETTDAKWLQALDKLITTLESPDQVLVSIISKSGNTTETVANFEIIMQALQTHFGQPQLQRVVAITDEDSPLWQAAGQKSIARLAIPSPVGGRYSVLSAAGLFVLATVGVAIDALQQGAAAMRDECFDGTINIAALSASLLAFHQQQGKIINDNFFFNPQLESVGKWYRQLMGESIGKEKSLGGQTIHAGITPTVSLGSTDLHSVGQLYLGGPKDKFTTFVYSQASPTVTIPEQRMLPELVPMINGKNASDIMQAIYSGVKTAYQKAALPYCEVLLDAIDEQNLGAYLQFKMLEMMYVGQLLQVNSFDQPSVESYKIETRTILEQAK